MKYRSSVKEKARELRRLGLSFREIASKQKLPLSTVHLWANDIALTQEQQNILREKQQQAFVRGRKIGQIQKHEKYIQQRREYFNDGFNAISNLSDLETTLVGIALYWGEGFKKDSRFGFANSDPKMIIFILNWLYRSMNVEKKDIRLRLGLNISLQARSVSILKKWVSITNIPLSQFQKTFYQRTGQLKKYDNTGDYLGVLRIRVNNHSELLPKITGMIAKVSNL